MLAEKYRPRTFEQVIGQTGVIRSLKYYLDSQGDKGQAFLLTGPSGSGKTTLAHCAAHYWGVDPWDVIKVESAECDVARLREMESNMHLCGRGGRGRKCYIIDEIHTVTGRAQDRLLSMLEDIPRHVFMVGTTTESDWTSATLFSRFVRLPLAKVSSAEVAKYLEDVAQRELLPIPADPQWAAKMVKYNGLNLRDLLNQLPARLLSDETAIVAA